MHGDQRVVGPDDGIQPRRRGTGRFGRRVDRLQLRPDGLVEQHLGDQSLLGREVAIGGAPGDERGLGYLRHVGGRALAQQLGGGGLERRARPPLLIHASKRFVGCHFLALLTLANHALMIHEFIMGQNLINIVVGRCQR